MNKKDPFFFLGEQGLRSFGELQVCVLELRVYGTLAI